MAYMSREHKAELAVTIKAILKKYNVQGSIAVRNLSTLVVNIKSGSIDFIANANDCRKVKADRRGEGFNALKGYIRMINPYHYNENFAGIALEFFSELIPAMYGPRYFDKSDAQIDYFNCSHYIEVNVGKCDKPYKLN